MSYTFTMPKPFDGTDEERATNYATHDFTGADGRCFFCDRRPSHYGASYPCGTSVPRIEVSTDHALKNQSFELKAQRKDK